MILYYIRSSIFNQFNLIQSVKVGKALNVIGMHSKVLRLTKIICFDLLKDGIQTNRLISVPEISKLVS